MSKGTTPGSAARARTPLCTGWGRPLNLQTQSTQILPHREVQTADSLHSFLLTNKSIFPEATFLGLGYHNHPMWDQTRSTALAQGGVERTRNTHRFGGTHNSLPNYAPRSSNQIVPAPAAGSSPARPRPCAPSFSDFLLITFPRVRRTHCERPEDWQTYSLPRYQRLANCLNTFEC